MTRHVRAGRQTPVVVALSILLLLVASLGAVAAALRPPVGQDEAAPVTSRSSNPSPTPTLTPTPTPDPDVELSLVAAGDVLPHLPVLSSARSADGGYDFGPLLEPLDPWVRGADLALCHLEVPVAPAGTAPSGYPMFATPAAIASGLRDQGWDGCSTASNHSVDRGFAGITATIDALDAAGLGHVGTARSAGEQTQPQVYTLDRAGRTVTVAHIAATYGTNGMPVDSDKPWSVDRIDVPAMVAQATAARAAGADVVIASVHCCVEYRMEPSPEQVAVDQELADSGVIDLVIGHHAHVPQPVTHLPGGPDGAGMWVAYGLGNFLSNQDGECCTESTDSGLLLSAQLRGEGAFPAQGRPAGPVRVTGVTWTPITVDRLGGHRVYALTDILAGAGSLSGGQVADRKARATAAAGTEAPERTTPLVATGPDPVVVRRVSG
ncbi:CapA family protein [Cellulomonas xylanilytica]|uniref:Capsule synthesis protein CapA domain-containing protein n=1 Tax=Cellulomonas xylanilytica TaxID=233583 RepID=A0A510V188_9CELL|nr:CapA family protein [Cellulomonas xylanilytica]GEK20677.1 hypothetical protein CXY01_11970 [Cellulomonas xylanilytica]